MFVNLHPFSNFCVEQIASRNHVFVGIHVFCFFIIFILFLKIRIVCFQKVLSDHEKLFVPPAEGCISSHGSSR